MPVDNKISNIIGVRIPVWLEDQLNIRSEQNSKSFRDNNNLVFISNKNAWVRLVSSINLTAESDRMRFSTLEVGTNVDSAADSLAKNFVLFGGTSTYLQQEVGGFFYNLRSGFGAGGAYGTLGQAEIENYGYRPMPGIISAKIETKGRLGSLREANISFKCWDKLQLDIIDALYFKLGYTMFLEWGNTYYYPSSQMGLESPVLSSTEFYAIDPFKEGLTKEEILKQISKNSRDSEGNYDAMLGMVTNFNFSVNSEGSYDCQLRLMALGGLADSIKINNPSNLPDILKGQTEQYANSLEEIIKKRREAEEKAEQDAKAKSEEEAKKKDATEIPISTPTTFNDFVKEFKSQPDSEFDYGSDVTAVEENGNFRYRQVDGKLVYGIRRLNKFIPGSYQFDDLNKFNFTIDTNYLFSSTGDFKSRFENPDSWKDYEFKDLYTSRKNKNTYGIKIKVDKKLILDERSLGKEEKIISINDYPEKVSNVNEITSNLSQTINNLKSFLEKGEKLKIVPAKEATDGFTVAEGRRFGFKFYIFLPYSIKAKVKTRDVARFGKEVEQIKSIKYTQKIVITLDDSRLIKDVSTSSKEIYQPQAKIEENIKKQDKKQTTDTNTPEQPQNANSEQTDSPLNYLSSLELILRSIQIYSLTIANKESQGELNFALPITYYENTDFIKQIFSEGIFSSFIEDLIDSENKITDKNYGKDGIGLDYNELLRIHAKYGFVSSLLANKVPLYDEEWNEPNFKPVNYRQLLTSFVVPYKMDQILEDGTPIQHPVYIPLGALLMILNHSSTIYDANEVGIARTPLIYIDYNPNHNFCLTIPEQLSADPWTCLIPFSGNNVDYSNLFDDSVLTDDRTAIKPLSGSTESTPLFFPQSEDFFSDVISELSPFKDDSDSIPYRGRIMNILINIDYIIKELRVYSTKNDENKVFLKPFLEQLIIDICKSTGNINLMRLGYNDEANALQIIDDQLIPSPDNEIQLQRSPDPVNAAIDNNPILPLFGKNSIAKSFDVKTEISSKLSNMIAISANANTANKSTLSSGGDVFGFINNNYVDRYIQNRQGPEDSEAITLTATEFQKLPPEDQQKTARMKGITVQKLTELLKDKDERIKRKQDTESEGLKNLSSQFNAAIKSYYASANPAQQYVGLASNYLINKLTYIKGNKKATQASAIIPVSINFTTDGISGFTMGHAFILPSEILPYTYTERPDPYGETDHLMKTGFVVTGVSHAIENNSWNTAIKGSMIFLKNRSDYYYSYEDDQQKETIITFDDDAIDDALSNKNYSNYPSVTKPNYSNIKFGSRGYLGNPADDKINPKLLQDINTAAKNAGIVVTITTAVSGHSISTSSGRISRHVSGNAIDIAFISSRAGNDIAVSNQQKIRPDAERFISQLQSLGYFNVPKGGSEIGYTKTILSYGFPKHDDHIHVSNKEVA